MNFVKQIIYSRLIPLIGKINNYRNKYINVIYYHDIVPSKGQTYMRTPFDIFKRQMEFIFSKKIPTYTFEELDNEFCKRSNSKGVLITFDDGWVSNYTMIFDMMKSLGLKYNIFLAVGKIGNDPEYLTWDQVRKMKGSGIVGFGAHTYNHVNMSSCNGINMTHEIHDANRKIEEETGIIVKDFCFPYGAYSMGSIDAIIAENAYDRIYTSDLNYSYPQKGTIIFGRNGISCAESDNVFKNKLYGYFNIFSKLTKKLRKTC